MTELFFQLSIAAICAFLGALVPLLSRRWQRRIMKLLGVVSLALILIWVGYELGVKYP